MGDNFKSFWTTQRKWLEDELAKSSATWQIVVTHYPPNFSPKAGELDLWPSLGKKYGIDLMVTGHTNHQRLFIHNESEAENATKPENKTKADSKAKADNNTMDMSDFPYVISGGGGGVFSVGTPSADGDDDEYGFVDFKISKSSMDIVMVSSTGKERHNATIYPRKAAPPVPGPPTKGTWKQLGEGCCHNLPAVSADMKIFDGWLGGDDDACHAKCQTFGEWCGFAVAFPKGAWCSVLKPAVVCESDDLDNKQGDCGSSGAGVHSYKFTAATSTVVASPAPVLI